jgi:hypothetical protein
MSRFAPHYQAIQDAWHIELQELRAVFTQPHGHRRTFANMASLALGWRFFLRFVVSAGALLNGEAEQVWR